MSSHDFFLQTQVPNFGPCLVGTCESSFLLSISNDADALKPDLTLFFGLQTILNVSLVLAGACGFFFEIGFQYNDKLLVSFQNNDKLPFFSKF